MSKTLRVLVCGGAGYIGSHMVKMLAEHGYAPATLDNLSTGHRAAVKNGEFIRADLQDPVGLEVALGRGQKYDAVIHMAACCLGPESVSNPGLYYQNNVIGALNLLEAMRAHGPEHLIFSSTCAVYGKDKTRPLTVRDALRPDTPYARTKVILERALADYAKAYNIRSASLRFSNAAGADPSGALGESHKPEPHLIPRVLAKARNPELPLKVYGNDHPTPDGTCVRDYVHVNDLCRAHLLALEYIRHHRGDHVFNLGLNTGVSVLDVIHAAREVTGAPIKYTMGKSRPQDASSHVTQSTKAKRVLGWKPRYTDIESIIETAWRWHREPQY